jgi:peptide/nickel transport system substrate-binding protein
MRLRRIAALSAVVALGATIATLDAARRPHYGGDLRIETRASLTDLDPTDWDTDASSVAARTQIAPLVYETLIRLDQHGQPQAWLATSWNHDRDNKRWIFSTRHNVFFHDGSKWSPPGGAIEMPDDRPIDQILRDLARRRNAIVQRAPDGSRVGTGPFRVAQWTPGRSGRLVANDAYWGGRPFLDSITIGMGRSLGEQASDFQLGKADAVEISARDLRSPRQNGSTFATRPVETLALRFEPGRVPDRVREAVALSIDRITIRDVLLQKQGDAAGAVLPQWLSGYSFVFPSARNIARARELASPGGSGPLAFDYDRQDTVIRPIAERIAVNANEAGVTLRNSLNNAADAPAVRLIRLPITASDPWIALGDIATLLKVALPENAVDPYEAEKALIGSFQVIPIVQIPQAWLLSTRVRNWPNCADTWLDAGGPQ